MIVQLYTTKGEERDGVKSTDTTQFSLRNIKKTQRNNWIRHLIM